MTSLKPYLIRSIYQWIIDNQLTPHLLVDAEYSDSKLPEEYIQEGQIVLNICPKAIQMLTLGNKEIEFNAYFSGKPLHISTPITAVLAIYAKENGKGMVFDSEDSCDDSLSRSTVKKQAKPPQLSIVK